MIKRPILHSSNEGITFCGKPVTRQWGLWPYEYEEDDVVVGIWYEQTTCPECVEVIEGMGGEVWEALECFA